MPTTAAVILAAGASRRFGGAKLLALVDGEALVRRTVRSFLGAVSGRTIAVLGARALEVESALAGLAVEIVVNDDWERGEMFSSVRAGLSALSPQPDWTLVSPADTPHLSAHLILRFIDALPAPDGLVVAVPSTGERRGHPLALSRQALLTVLDWKEKAARLDRVFADPAFRVHHVTGFGPEILHDVDRPEDLDSWRNRK